MNLVENSSPYRIQAAISPVDDSPVCKLSDKLLRKIFLSLNKKSDFLTLNIVCKRWRRIADIKYPLPIFSPEVWENIFSFLDLKDLARASGLSKQANASTELCWRLKAAKYCYSSTRSNACKKSKEYLARLFGVLVQLYRKGLLPRRFTVCEKIEYVWGVIPWTKEEKIPLHYDSFLLKENILCLTRDDLIKLLLNKNARTIPNLDDFIRYRILNGDEGNILPMNSVVDEHWTAVAANILKEGKNPNTQREESRLPLFRAAEEGNKNQVRALICFTSDINVQTKCEAGLSALTIAARWGKKDVVKLLLKKKADPTQYSKEGRLPLHSAVAAGHLEIVQILLSFSDNINAQGNDGGSALCYAAQWGKTDVVKLLLKEKADPAQYSKDGWLPLHFAAERGHLEIVQILLPFSDDINVQTKCEAGISALNIAAQWGKTDVVKLLLKEKADPTQYSKEGWLPLHDAAEGGHLEIVQILLPFSDDINVQGKNGGSALTLAASRGKTDVVKLLLKEKADPAQYSKEEWLPLHFAAEGGYLEIVQILLPLSDDIDVQSNNKRGSSALALAAARGKLEVVNFLLQKKANPNLYSKEGQLPLHYAAAYGHLEVVKLLLPLADNIQAQLALRCVPENGNEEVIKLLLLRISTNVFGENIE